MQKYLETDEQTREDLRLFMKHRELGIMDWYTHTHTRGGEELLWEFFKHPLAEKAAIEQRIALFSQLATEQVAFPFAPATFDQAERYIRSGMLGDPSGKGRRMGERELELGVLACLRLLQEVKEFYESNTMDALPAFAAERQKMLDLLGAPELSPLFTAKVEKKLSYAACAAFDVLIRQKEFERIESIIHHIYQLDAYISIAQSAKRHGFDFPKVHERGTGVFRLQGVYYPDVKQAVSNDFSMDADHCLLYLTGANMAGKSTFLRSVSLAVYLAHLGFPIPAQSMEFSVLDGMYTTINLPDNLGMGASHFYAEVSRVKKIAQQLNQDKHIYVVFDELFRGTNVKDAKEATEAVSLAFAKHTDSRFIISSHIVEAAEVLKQSPSIGFKYLPTLMNGNVPTYTYKLQEGVTEDRHGMLIIRNEGVLDILKKGTSKGHRLKTKAATS